MALRTAPSLKPKLPRSRSTPSLSTPWFLHCSHPIRSRFYSMCFPFDVKFRIASLKWISLVESSSVSQILCTSFNRHSSVFVIGENDGLKIFEATNKRLCYDKTGFITSSAMPFECSNWIYSKGALAL